MAEKDKRGRARSTFRDVINEAATREKVQQLVDQALTINGLVNVYCPQCKKMLKAEMPNVKGRIDALVALLEQAEGKPGQEEAGVSIVVERPPWPTTSE